MMPPQNTGHSFDAVSSDPESEYRRVETDAKQK
jgi:hypothetical protein